MSDLTPKPEPAEVLDRRQTQEALGWCVRYIEATDARRRPPEGQPFLNERLIRYAALANGLPIAAAPEPPWVCPECLYTGIPERDHNVHAALRARTEAPPAHICANHDESLDEAYRKGLAVATEAPPATDEEDTALTRYNELLANAPRHSHRDFASRDACESCMAVVRAGQAIRATEAPSGGGLAATRFHCPAAKHHRVRRIRSSGVIVDWTEDGPIRGDDVVESDACNVCGYNFEYARLRVTAPDREP